jgi:glutathione synthase
MELLFVMDPLDRILPDRDTTLALMRAAQARGHRCLHCLPSQLEVADGRVRARARQVELLEAPPHFSASLPAMVHLAEVSAVFIRADPPFDTRYLNATLVLESARGGPLLVNDPRGLREANEKLYALNFPALIPRTLVSADPASCLAFAEAVGRAVIKPLHGCGGCGVMLLERADRNCRSIVDHLTGEGRHYVVVQEYLPAVREGDKRILILDGEVLGAINRVPRDDDLRANIHVGGRVEPTTVTPAERALVAAMAPRLRADGLFLVGIDTIGGKLTEVNVTSPTGLQELSRHLGREVADDVIRWTEERVRANRA